MFTGGRGGRNWALIQRDREDICVWHKLNGLATFFSFFLHKQYHSVALIKSRAAPVRLERSGFQRLIAYMLQQQLFELQLLPQLQ